MQIKTTLRYHLIPVRVGTIKNLQIHVSENLEKRESQYIVGGNINWCSYYGKMKFLPKTKNRYTK